MYTEWSSYLRLHQFCTNFILTLCEPSNSDWRVGRHFEEASPLNFAFFILRDFPTRNRWNWWRFKTKYGKRLRIFETKSFGFLVFKTWEIETHKKTFEHNYFKGNIFQLCTFLQSLHYFENIVTISVFVFSFQLQIIFWSLFWSVFGNLAKSF